MFKIGDWVQITSSEDNNWKHWRDNRTTYNKFLGKIGIVQKIIDDEERRSYPLYSVRVEFSEDSENLAAGSYCEYFRPGHLIRSSKYEKELQEHRKKAEKELQEWEVFKKKTTHENLKKVFSKEQEKEPVKEEEIKEDTHSRDWGDSAYDWNIHDYNSTTYDD